LRESGCLSVSFCIEIYVSELFWVRVLILCATVFGVLDFLTWSPSSFPQRGVCWKLCPLKGSCCGADYLFSLLSEGTRAPAL
jgi:hypothetical protein